jgi:hypothetical protein
LHEEKSWLQVLQWLIYITANQKGRRNNSFLLESYAFPTNNKRLHGNLWVNGVVGVLTVAGNGEHTETLIV